MLLVEAKGREYVENANHELGVNPGNATDEMKQNSESKLVGEKLDNADPIISTLNIDTSKYNAYKLSESVLEDMGIRDVDSNEQAGWYVIAYDVNDVEVKIYNTKGVQLSDGTVKYCLDDIRDVNE